MKKILILLLVTFSTTVYAKEIISIQTPYGPSHAGNAAMMKIIDEANKVQNKYTFILENRPGGNQSIALNHINKSPNTQLAIIAASFVENFQTGQVKRELYNPIWSLGDACWAVYSLNGKQGSVDSLRGSTNEITAGSVAIGNATHLTSLVIGERLSIPIRFVVFKSSNESLVNMVGNNGVTFTTDRAENFETFKPKNDKLVILAMTCPQRHPAYPEIRTLKEQGYDTPFVFNTLVAHRDMNKTKQDEIANIFTSATNTVGKQWILQNSGFVPPQFSNVTAKQHLDNSINLMIKLRAKYAKDIATDK